MNRTPEKIMDGTIECKIWGICVHGAGCKLSTFDYSGEKKMPLVIIHEGIPVCYDYKRG